MQTTISSTFYVIAALLVASCTALPVAAPIPESDEPVDSYSNIPITNGVDEVPQESPLSLQLLPPAVVASAAPHIYYMGSDGVAVPAEGENYRRFFRKRDVAPEKSKDETMQTDETFFALPSSQGNRRSGCLGGRPSKSYYARRYHKYPWNYH